jgi:hypothetical protein
MSKLREFKSKYLSKLLELRRELLSKYPDRSERVKHVIDTLITKLYNLRVFTLSDYLHTLYLVAKEFPELEQLIPSSQEIEELLGKHTTIRDKE